MCSCVQMNTWLSIFCVDIAVILENANIRLDLHKATIAVAEITFTVLLSLYGRKPSIILVFPLTY